MNETKQTLQEDDTD